MDKHILWNKIARIIMQLSETLDITMSLFYESETCTMLHDLKYGLHLMSETYLVNDIIEELREKQE